MATVSRRDRLVDLAAVLCILAGAALYVSGTVHLRQIAQLSWQHPGPLGVKQLDEADRARYACNAGIGLVVVGALVGAGAAVGHSRRKREA